jgi:UDP-3-O-[3-hydroxymyristoyl] glucosamine N-acyltransferase
MHSRHAVIEGETGPDCRVGHFAVIAAGARIGAGCVIHPHAFVGDGVVLGDEVEVFHSAVVGKEPKGAGATARVPEFERRVRLGDGCSVGPHATIYYDVEIGERTLIGDGASIREQGRIGSRCIVSRCVTLNYDAVLGDRVKVMDNSHVTGHTVIEDDAFVSTGVVMANDNAPTKGLPADEARLVGPRIGPRVVVGAGATLLPAVVIGADAIVGAGALVTRDVAPGTRVMGVPARPA